jgi:hypothetical protein
MWDRYSACVALSVTHPEVQSFNTVCMVLACAYVQEISIVDIRIIEIENNAPPNSERENVAMFDRCWLARHAG